MNKYKGGKLVRILALALLLSLIGTVMLGAHVSGSEGDAAPQYPSACTSGALAGQQECYTIDTSRPEWLEGWTVIYLPIVMKGESP